MCSLNRIFLIITRWLYMVENTKWLMKYVVIKCVTFWKYLWWRLSTNGYTSCKLLQSLISTMLVDWIRCRCLVLYGCGLTVEKRRIIFSDWAHRKNSVLLRLLFKHATPLFIQYIKKMFEVFCHENLPGSCICIAHENSFMISVYVVRTSFLVNKNCNIVDCC